jgi:glutathione S-transferase
MAVKLYGYPEVPYVAKVQCVLALKGIVDYEHDMIFPFTDRKRMDEINPKFGKVPVLEIDGKRTPESSDICRLLDATFPDSAPAFPRDPALMKKAADIEAWADKELGALTGLPILLPLILIPRYMPEKEPPAAEVIAASKSLLAEMHKKIESMDWMSGETKFLAGDEISVADVALLGWLRVGEVVGIKIDPSLTPRLAAFAARVRSVPAFAKFEKAYREIPGIAAFPASN